jgi:hypothetical protein
MFEALFRHYFSMVYAQASADMKSDWIALDSKLRQVTQAQAALESQAHVISQRQKLIDTQHEKALAVLAGREAKGKAQIKRKLAKVRRIQKNERFAKWLDNSCWGLQRWCETVIHKVNWWSGDIKVLFAVLGVSLFIVAPVCTTLSLKLLLSDRCIQTQQCRSIALWMADIRPPASPNHHKNRKP